MSRQTRRRVPYPPAAVPDDAPVTLARPGNWAPALGSLSKPADNIPRRVVIVAPAYNGAPVRRGLTMPGGLDRPRQGKHGYGFRRFDGILATGAGDGGAVDSIHPFGVPPIGNVIPSPVFRPPAPVVEAQGPPVTTARVRRMVQTRRLNALLPNPRNFYHPMRYGEDYDGVRGGGGVTPGAGHGNAGAGGPLGGGGHHPLQHRPGHAPAAGGASGELSGGAHPATPAAGVPRPRKGKQPRRRR